MNISITKLIVLILGIALLGASVFFAIEAISATNWLEGAFALVGIVVGYGLISSKGINITQ